MNVQDLRSQWLSRKDGHFQMPQKTLGWAAADDLWAQCFTGGELALTNATPDADKLTVSGNLALLGSSDAPPAVVEFLSADGLTVDGVRVTAESSTLRILASCAKIDLSQDRFLSFSAAGLLLASVSDPTQPNRVSTGFCVRTPHVPGSGPAGVWLWARGAVAAAQALFDPLSTTFFAELADPLDAKSLDGLVDFAPNLLFRDVLPALIVGGHNLTQLRQVEYFAHFDPAGTGRLSWISSFLRIRIAQGFEVVKGQITLDFLDAEATILAPASASPIANFTLGGQFDFGDEQSRAAASGPVKTDLVITWDPASLTQSPAMPILFVADTVCAIDLQSVFRRFFKTSDLGPLDGLAITGTRIQGNLGARFFELSLTLGRPDNQPFTLIGPLALESIWLTLDYDAGQGVWSAALGAALDIAKERLAVNVYYDGSVWQLDAMLDKATDGTSPDFFDNFAQQFNGGAALPDDVRAATLQELSLSGTLDSARKGGQVTVNFIGTVPFCGNNVGVVVDAALSWGGQKDGANGFECAFTGQLTLPPTPSVKEAQVLSVTYAAGALTGQWAAAGGASAPLLEALAAWFGFDQIPALLPDPSLSSLSLFHDARGVGAVATVGHITLGFARWTGPMPGASSLADLAGPAASTPPSMAVLALDLGMAYSQSPLAPGNVPAGQDFGVSGAQVVYANAAVGASGSVSLEQLFALLPAGGPALPAASLSAGVSLAPTIVPAGLAGGPVALNAGGASSAARLAFDPAARGAPDSDPSGARALVVVEPTVWEIVDADQDRAPAGFSAASARAPRGGFGRAQAVRGSLPGVLGSGSGGAFLWLPVNRSLGPVSIGRLGIGYGPNAKGEPSVSLGVDAGFSVGGFSIEFIGLTFGHDFKADAELDVGLDGIAIALDDGAISFSGQFLKTTGADGQPEYAGGATLSAANFELVLEGAYSKGQNGDASFFAFGMLDEALGGPPWAFVTGLAGAIGLHRSLTLPALADLPTFPLVAAAIASSPSQNPFSGAQDPAGDLAVLEQWVPVDYGSKWFGVGARFSSFGLLESFALLTACFGAKTQFALLGMTALTLPKGSPEPIAYAEVAIEATLDPSAGILQVLGALTPQSYVISPSCQLQGGFAFCSWFKDQGAGQASAGEFVFSLGGYHPSFQAPSYYPSPARVSAHWPVTDCLNIDGDFYFALTPGALMAGGALNAVWESDGLRAWFSEGADFFLGWRPFHYEADISVSLGVSYTLDLLFTSVSISVSLDVDVSLAGPPLHGEIDVDLYVVSFSISFGDRDDQELNPIPWEAFKTSLLPNGQALPPVPAPQPSGEPTPIDTDALCRIRASSGLVRDLTSPSAKRKAIRRAAGAPADDFSPDWILNPHGFELSTESLFVSTSLSLGGVPQQGSWASGVEAGPSNISDYQSAHAISLATQDGKDVSSFLELSAVQQSAPRATWNIQAALSPSVDDLNRNGTTIPGALVGARLAPARNTPDTLPTPLPMGLLEVSDAPTPISFPGASGFAPPANPFDQSQAQSQFDSTIGDPTFLNQVIALAAKNGSSASAVSPGAVAELASGDYLLAPPMLAPAGDEQA
jgi:hypothetical protein